MSEHCINVNGLLKTYGDLTAVNRISFQVNHGEILGILGPNGSGKTTTIKSILGLIRFDEGSISVHGMDAVRNRRKMLERTGAVLEGARNTYWYLSPRENLAYFAGSRGVSSGEAAERAEKLLKSLDLWDVADKEMRQFSAGMKQKCAIACAFVHDPDLLLLDEPTLGLDVAISRQLRAWLREMVNESGKTILITSHNMDFIESVCDRVLVMRKGEIVSHETVASLKRKFAGKYFLIDLKSRPTDSLISLLSDLGGLSTEGKRLTLELSSLDRLGSMVNALESSGCGIEDFRTVENDLEDIFLNIIGEGEGNHEKNS